MYSVYDVCQYSEYSMSRWHGGKGSTRRPTNTEAYNDGWDRIFNKDKEYTPSDADVLEHIRAESEEEEEESDE